MLMREAVLAQISHQETNPVPYLLDIDAEIAGQLDAYFGSKEWRAANKPYIVKIRALDADQYTSIDSTHSIDAFGTVWRTDLRPQHQERPALVEPSFAGYQFPKPEQFFSPQMREQAVQRCHKHPDSFRVALIGWGLFERSWTIRGFQDALMDAVAEPAFYEELLDRILQLQLAFVAEAATLPVDGIMFSDDWGDQRGVLLGPERWRKFIKPRVAQLYEAAHRAGKITLNHVCGNVADIMPDLIEIGLDVLQSVQPEAMNPYELKRKWGKHITFWGGLDSQSTIPFGTPEQIRAEVKRLCTEMAKGGGYILGPAKPLQPGTPIENAVAVLDAFVNQA